jgi:hypothetical protein
MKISKEEALRKIWEAQAAECAAFGSGVISPVMHLNFSAIFQMIEREMEKSQLTEFECES